MGLKLYLTLTAGVLIFLLGVALTFSVSSQANLKLKLIHQQERSAGLQILADHRQQQLDRLYELLNAHNARLAQDQEILEDYQHKLEEMEDYFVSQMADRSDVCLDTNIIDRLRQTWPSPSSTHNPSNNSPTSR